MKGMLQKIEKKDHQTAIRKNFTDAEDWIDYTIKPGDTLWALAVKRFHVKVEDLIREADVDPSL